RRGGRTRRRRRGSAGRDRWERWSRKLLSAQAADSGGGGLPRGVGVRAEGGTDVLVAQVVAVAEDDRGALGRRQPVREVLDLGVGGPRVDRRVLGGLTRRSPPPVGGRRDARRDRVRPRTQLAPVLEPVVRAERAQERLLEGVLGVGDAEPAAQEGEDLTAPGLVEALEGRNRHGVHHAL